MSKRIELWSRFERSGSIADYLAYRTAATDKHGDEDNTPHQSDV